MKSRLFIGILWVLLGCLMAKYGFAQSTKNYVLTKSSIQNVKIISNHYDHIHFFIKDTSANTFRIGGLTQTQAANILHRLHDGLALNLSTTASEQGYREVTAWE